MEISVQNKIISNKLYILWLTENNAFTDNYVLKGADPNTMYALMSAIQVEKGPRLFYPQFGFFYKAKNTRVKVLFHDQSASPPQTHTIYNVLENEESNDVSRQLEWKYFAKNLSDISYRYII